MKKTLLLFLVVPLIAFGQWTQTGTDIDGEAADDLSGSAVSLSSDGSVLAIGANENDGNGLDSGHVRVYENQGGVWIQIGDDIDGEEIEVEIPEQVHKEFKVLDLINGYRTRGHLFTKTNPVRERRGYTPTLALENFGL